MGTIKWCNQFMFFDFEDTMEMFILVRQNICICKNYI